jgi:hypothetical protein
MDQKSQSATDTASSSERKNQADPTTTSMNELFQQLPEHVRISQRRGVTTGLIGHRGSSK